MGLQCPKCGHRQQDPEACHRCGLVFALAPKENPPWEAVPVGCEAAVEEFERRWEEVREAPDDASLHDDVVGLVGAEGIHAWAIRRYRFLISDLEAEGRDAAVPRQVLDGLVQQVQVRARALFPTLEGGGGGREGAKRFRRWMTWGLVALCVVALFVLLQMMSWTRSMQLY